MSFLYQQWSGSKRSFYYDDGNDYASFVNYADLTVYTRGGDDVVVASGVLKVLVDSGTGSDNITVKRTEDATVYAGSGNDTVTIAATVASALVEADDGNDLITFQASTGTVNGGAGNDTIHVTSSSALVSGGDGNDTIVWHGDQLGYNEWWIGGDLVSANNISGGAGNDTLVLAEDAVGAMAWIDQRADGIENLIGNSKDNSFRGTGVANTIEGKGGNDVIQGGGGTDYLSGGDGDDWISAGNDASTLHGGNGNDTLVLGYDNKAIGGWGEDLYVIESYKLWLEHHANLWAQYMTIKDFEQGYDRIKLEPGNQFDISPPSPSGEVRLNIWGKTVAGDNFGATIFVTMKVGTTLTASDFVFG